MRHRTAGIAMELADATRVSTAQNESVDPLLRAAIRSLAPRGILVGHRLIVPGDELGLLPEEAAAIPSRVAEVRRASGAVRIVARGLLARIGHPDCALPTRVMEGPRWPAGVIGSLAHDAHVAIAAVGTRRDARAVGIDIEPPEILPPETLELVATPEERRRIADDPWRGRLLFAAKEAVYKAVYPLDGVFLEHHDIVVDFARQKAFVRNGREVDLRFSASTHLVALALVP